MVFPSKFYGSRPTGKSPANNHLNVNAGHCLDSPSHALDYTATGIGN